METIYRQTFTNETIVLDNKYFVECNVDGCKVVHAGGAFAQLNSRFTNCTPVVAGDAIYTLNFMRFFGSK